MPKNSKNSAAVNKVKLCLVFWGFLIIVFSAAIYVQVRKETGLTSEIESLTRQRDDANLEQSVLHQKIELKTSQKSIEDYAHEHGLVYPNEIIIYDDNYKSDK